MQQLDFRRVAAVLFFIVYGTLPLACKRSAKREEKRSHAPPVQRQTAATAAIDADMLAAFAPLPAAMVGKSKALVQAQVDLGRMLYYDTRLSKNHDVSCNSCHLLAEFGVDGKVVSLGHRGQKGSRNSPTVYNAAGHFSQFWDGRAADVEEQAKGPVLNPVEMAMPSEKAVVAVLQSIPGYVTAFAKAFPDDKNPLSYDNMARAIGAFERRLTTPAAWDRFLKGDKAALSSAERAGFKEFVGAGCPTCHTGPYLGGHIFQKLGLVKPWPQQQDQGRFEVTKQEADRMVFKVPSLRNVEKTSPYFHDGSEPDLAAAVKKMAKHQLAKDLDETQLAAIVAFLKTLTGEIPQDYIKPPVLPPSGPKTPRPDPA